jgi:internalin A
VTDFSPLSSLRDLTTVNIYFSRRAQFSPLPQLRQLQAWNSDSDLAALPAMPNLTSLSAHFVDLSAKNALAPLRSMTTLRNLALVNSVITDVSGLETLTELVTLDLSRNNIGDLSPLLQTAAFGFGTSIDIRDNPITCDDPSIAALLEREVQIQPCGL